MEIRIDTKRDSPEDIRKAVRMLQAYLGDGILGDSIGSQRSSPAEATPDLFSMFGDEGDSSLGTSSPSSSVYPSSSSSSASSSSGTVTAKDLLDEDDGTPQITPY